MPPARSRWLFGPGRDLWLGCGGAYAVVLVLLWSAPQLVQAAVPLGMLPLLVLVTGVPHYGATLVRVYEHGADRDAYRFFTVWTTLAVYAWFALGVYHAALGSWLVTLYLTWSPWHYTGQNYGIAVMFLRRDGAGLGQGTKRWLYASYVLSYAIAFLGIHAATVEGSTEYTLATSAGSAYELLRLGIPAGPYRVLLAIAGGAWALCTGGAALQLKRGREWRALAAPLSLSALQAVWFSLPALAQASGLGVGLLGVNLQTYGLLWIATAHAVQYLWVTSYYASGSERVSRHVWKAWMAGCAVWGLPAFLFAPDLLGVRAFDAGLGLLVASAVNVHHFILDGAIWKLRDGRVARILLRPRADREARPADPPRLVGERLARAGVVMLGLGYVATVVIGTLEVEYGIRRAEDYERMQTAIERLRWVGRDHPEIRYQLGRAAFERGDLEGARREFGRSLELSPDRHDLRDWLERIEAEGGAQDSEAG